MNTVQLAKALGCNLVIAQKWLNDLDAAMLQFGITSINEQASFLAQVGHESNGLSMLEENLNYSADALARVWPSRYADPKTKQPNTLAVSLHRKPQAIANNVYANRMGNGPESSGNGWDYRGRGPIQITGLNNYSKCGAAIGFDLIHQPDLLLQPRAGSLSAGWYWHINNLDKYDDDLSMLAETKIINGGTNGLEDRERRFKMALSALQQGN